MDTTFLIMAAPHNRPYEMQKQLTKADGAFYHGSICGQTDHF